MIAAFQTEVRNDIDYGFDTLLKNKNYIREGVNSSPNF